MCEAYSWFTQVRKKLEIFFIMVREKPRNFYVWSVNFDQKSREKSINFDIFLNMYMYRTYHAHIMISVF